MAKKIIANAGDTAGLKVLEEIITRIGGEVQITGCTNEDEFIDATKFEPLNTDNILLSTDNDWTYSLFLDFFTGRSLEYRF